MTADSLFGYIIVWAYISVFIIVKMAFTIFKQRKQLKTVSNTPQSQPSSTTTEVMIDNSSGYYGKLNSLNATIAVKDERILDLEAQLATSEKFLKEKDSEINELRERNSQLKQENSEIEDMNRKLLQLNHNVEQLSDYKNYLCELLQQKELEISFLDNRCTTLFQNNQILRQQQEQTNSNSFIEKNKLLEQISILRRAADLANQHKVTAETNIANLQKEHTEQKILLQTLTAKLEMLQARLDYILKFSSPTEENYRLGTAYELQVGKMYEKKGYHVLYSGIVRGIADGGIDLIAISPKADKVEIIQCKNYSERSTLHPNDLHSFVTAIKPFCEQCPVNVQPILFCTPSTLFDESAFEMSKAYNFKISILHFENIWFKDLYRQVDSIRQEQTSKFIDKDQRDISHKTIHLIINEIIQSENERFEESFIDDDSFGTEDDIAVQYTDTIPEYDRSDDINTSYSSPCYDDGISHLRKPRLVNPETFQHPLCETDLYFLDDDDAYASLGEVIEESFWFAYEDSDYSDAYDNNYD